VPRFRHTVTFVASATASMARSDDEGDAGASSRRSDKASEAVPPPPGGPRPWRAISLSFVVADALASTPPLFSTSPRQGLGKRHRISETRH